MVVASKAVGVWGGEAQAETPEPQYDLEFWKRRALGFERVIQDRFGGQALTEVFTEMERIGAILPGE